MTAVEVLSLGNQEVFEITLKGVLFLSYWLFFFALEENGILDLMNDFASYTQTTNKLCTGVICGHIIIDCLVLSTPSRSTLG